MKKILLIATGGTIACTDSKRGLSPTVGSDELISYIAGAGSKNYADARNCDVVLDCKINSVSLMNIDSTNMTPALMGEIANAVSQYYTDYDGFVITHGTDTLGYTAAALCYMMQNLSKPVILTGSQLPIAAPNTDAITNLSDAIAFACTDLAGVYVAFDGILINGTHARKLKTRSKDAFVSVNCPEAAYIKNGHVTRNPEYERLIGDVMPGGLRIDSENENLTGDAKLDRLCVDIGICADIAVLNVFPGMKKDILDYVRCNCKGVIAAGFGIGGIPNVSGIADALISLDRQGISVAVATQCTYEGTDLSIYEVGRNLFSGNIINSADMTIEALTMKLMWALAHYDSAENVKKFVETPVYCDTLIPGGSATDKTSGTIISENSRSITDSSARRIYEAVKKIPAGHVATYSQIAELAGNKGMARAVGNALHKNPDPEHIPCFRVVNSKGELAAEFAFGGAEAQARLLMADGVEVIDGKVDLEKFGINLG